MEFSLPLPSEPTLLTPAESALEQMRAIVIDSPDMAQAAATERAAINTKAKELEDQRLEIVRQIERAKEPVNALFRRPIALLKEARSIVDEKILNWQRKVDRERREAQAAIEAAARKEQEALLRRSASAQAKGQTEKASVLADTAAAIPAAVTLPTAPKLQGAHEVKRYRAEVVDKIALIEFIAANLPFINLVTPDQTAINALARAQRDAFSVPGCRLVVDSTLTSR